MVFNSIGVFGTEGKSTIGLLVIFVLKNLLRLMKNQIIGVIKISIIVEIGLSQDKFLNFQIKVTFSIVIFVTMKIK